MESTGVYWIPLFQILEERGFKVYLVIRGKCDATNSPRGLSVRRYTVSGKGQRVLVMEERQRRPNNSLGLSPSVISMLDSLHLSKVVEGDLAWP